MYSPEWVPCVGSMVVWRVAVSNKRKWPSGSSDGTTSDGVELHPPAHDPSEDDRPISAEGVSGSFFLSIAKVYAPPGIRGERIDPQAEEARNAGSSTPEHVAERQAPTSSDAHHLRLSLLSRIHMSQCDVSTSAHPSEAISPALYRQRAKAPADAAQPEDRVLLPKTEEISSESNTIETGTVGSHGLPGMEPRSTVAATDLGYVKTPIFPVSWLHRTRMSAVVALLLALAVIGFDQGILKRTSMNGPDDHAESIAVPATLSPSSEVSGGEDEIAFMALTKEPAAAAAQAPLPVRSSLPVPRSIKIDEPQAISDTFSQGQHITGTPSAEDIPRYEQVASTAIMELPKLIDQGALLTGPPIYAAQIGSPMRMVSDQPTAASDQETLAAIEVELAITVQDRAALQRRLGLLGFDPRGVDGIFGPKSRAAISSWQSAQGFPATGYLDADQVADIITMSRHLYADWAASVSLAKNAGVAGNAPGAAN
jgi:hypothetical protein